MSQTDGWLVSIKYITRCALDFALFPSASVEKLDVKIENKQFFVDLMFFGNTDRWI
ncbi:hypothetical protein [Undibacterium baiyunense]|uniref:Uncharacterized protein n=1 Tax=Undibacterium baiyunense TaxID=2828731 RepID=A0A941DG09_9BURK|nr:hypothetical protein [Undibacterium baiyunense]MBR7746958.1 hypothetical protein [Undibacterium baiyunense]